MAGARWNFLRHFLVPGLAAILLCLANSHERGLAAADLTPSGSPAKAQPESLRVNTNRLVSGEATARLYCSTCHLFPEPSLLDKKTWLQGALPQMAPWLGVQPPTLTGRPDRQIIEEARVFPPGAILSEPEWREIIAYYEKNAPATPLPQPARDPIRMELRHFRVKPHAYRNQAPRISLVQIDATRKRIFVSDGQSGRLEVVRADGSIDRTTELGSGTVRLRPSGSNALLTLIGRVLPSDELAGTVGLLQLESLSFQKSLTGLRRPSDALLVDCNQDGRDDLVVCQFGNRLGAFSWFEALEDGQWREHRLIDHPGATRVAAHDFNQDGKVDLLVQMAQGREGLFLFLNRGAGRFEMTTVVEVTPAFGFSGFELVDFNGDGRIDILATNGDNGDFPNTTKAYHGIRLYQNQGGLRFEERLFYPLNGAYRALARDFDRDGDLDIAAISFFPDYLRSPEESFVYLEQRERMSFQAGSLPEARKGRWLTMDAGDLDGDGDEDLALGSFLPGPLTIPIPRSQSELWRTNPTALLVLENTIAK